MGKKNTARIALPHEAIVLASTVRDRFPGLTDPEIATELLKRGIDDSTAMRTIAASIGELDSRKLKLVAIFTKGLI